MRKYSRYPFVNRYTPVFRVSGKWEDPSVLPSIDRRDASDDEPHSWFSPKTGPPLVEEPRNYREECIRVLIEAWRGLHRRYGETLVFSRPKRSHSLVYRSESKHWPIACEDRFPWRLHVYQCACASTDELEDQAGSEEGGPTAVFPGVAIERYAGFVFVRPWRAHLDRSKTRVRTDGLNSGKRRLRIGTSPPRSARPISVRGFRWH